MHNRQARWTERELSRTTEERRQVQIGHRDQGNWYFRENSLELSTAVSEGYRPSRMHGR